MSINTTESSSDTESNSCPLGIHSTRNLGNMVVYEYQESKRADFSEYSGSSSDLSDYCQQTFNKKRRHCFTNGGHKMLKTEIPPHEIEVIEISSTESSQEINGGEDVDTGESSEFPDDYVIEDDGTAEFDERKFETVELPFGPEETIYEFPMLKPHEIKVEPEDVPEYSEEKEYLLLENVIIIDDSPEKDNERSYILGKR